MWPKTRVYLGGGLLLYCLVSLVISVGVAGKPPNLFSIGAAILGTWWLVRGSRERAEEQAANAAEAERRRLANPNGAHSDAAAGGAATIEIDRDLIIHTVAYVASAENRIDDADVAMLRSILSRLSGQETSSAQTRKLMEKARADSYLGLPRFARFEPAAVPGVVKRHLIHLAVKLWAREDPPSRAKRERIAEVARALGAHTQLVRILYEHSNPKWRDRREKSYPAVVGGKIAIHALFNAAQFVAQADGAIDRDEIAALHNLLSGHFGAEFSFEEIERLLGGESFGDFLEDPAFDGNEDAIAAFKTEICLAAFCVLYAGGELNEARLEAINHVAAVLDAAAVLADFFDRATQIVAKRPD